MLTAFRADLHCHSSCSDGSLSPLQLLKLASEKQLSGLSITDHDTLKAYELIGDLPQQWGIDLLTGVEFSTYHLGEPVHVLAYGFDPKDPHLQALCKRHEARRLQRARQMLYKLNDMGFSLTEAELIEIAGEGLASIGRPHLAKLLMKKKVVTSVQEAFHKYLGNNKPAFVQGLPITCEETLDSIKKAGAVPVLAHPHLLKSLSFLKKLLPLGFEGIECYYANMPLSRESYFLQIAQEKQLLITGGSDFHGSCKPDIELGASYVDKAGFDHLKQAIGKARVNS